MNKSILMSGVGGQGTILASKLLTTGLMHAGYDVKMSEIHGMSQRGGDVTSHIRYGDKIYSPVIEKGCADILASFEKIEALRNLPYLNPAGILIVNDCRIDPMGVLSGAVEYPENVLEVLKDSVNTIVINASDIAISLGNLKVMNIVMLGAIVKYMKLLDLDWEEIIRNNVKEAFIDINIKAFKAGLA